MPCLGCWGEHGYFRVQIFGFGAEALHLGHIEGLHRTSKCQVDPLLRGHEDGSNFLSWIRPTGGLQNIRRPSAAPDASSWPLHRPLRNVFVKQAGHDQLALRKCSPGGVAVRPETRHHKPVQDPKPKKHKMPIALAFLQDGTAEGQVSEEQQKREEEEQRSSRKLVGSMVRAYVRL